MNNPIEQLNNLATFIQILVRYHPVRVYQEGSGLVVVLHRGTKLLPHHHQWLVEAGAVPSDSGVDLFLWEFRL